MGLLIIADDFTGALDTGAQFAKAGVSARVRMDAEQPLPAPTNAHPVLVVNAETRHLPPGHAAGVVYRIAARAMGEGYTFFYKKTDSGLRGNIGAELEALLAATGERALCFAPAFPGAGRVTRGGVQYADGVPVAEAAFGRDPFAPVCHSSVQRIIGEQSGLPVRVISDRRMPPPSSGSEREILVFDAETDGDLLAVARAAHGAGNRAMAGCAGFAAALPDALALPRASRGRFAIGPGMIVVSGSVNPVTLAQIRYASARGFPCLMLSAAQKFSPGYAASAACAAFLDKAVELFRAHGTLILAASDSGLSGDAGGDRLRVAENIGAIAARLRQRAPDAAHVYFGGDTLLAAMRQAGLDTFAPVGEIAPGVVLAEASGPSGVQGIITKSGGFGAEDILPAIHRYLMENRGEDSLRNPLIAPDFANQRRHEGGNTHAPV